MAVFQGKSFTWDAQGISPVLLLAANFAGATWAEFPVSGSDQISLLFVPTFTDGFDMKARVYWSYNDDAFEHQMPDTYLTATVSGGVASLATGINELVLSHTSNVNVVWTLPVIAPLCSVCVYQAGAVTSSLVSLQVYLITSGNPNQQA